MNTSILTRAARRVAGIIAECNYAQRRMLTLRTAPDRYLIDPGTAASNYAEFLFRTSGICPHEPTAAARARGQLVG
jgi:hypothetical protein